MLCAEIEQYLHAQIPLSKEMGVSVLSVEDGVRLAAPLSPNINHRSTVFGGSISALAILSAWTLMYLKLQAIPCRIVIQSNRMEYLAPIQGDFQAYCPLPPVAEWERFTAMLHRRSKARITLQAQILSAQGIGGTFVGDYVALKS